MSIDIFFLVFENVSGHFGFEVEWISSEICQTYTLISHQNQTLGNGFGDKNEK